MCQFIFNFTFQLPGAMKLAEQSRGYMFGFKLTKPSQLNQVLLVQ